MVQKIVKVINRALDKALAQFGTISIDQFLVLTVICVLFIMIVTFIRIKQDKDKVNLKNVFALLSLAVYINIILQLTLLGRAPGSRIGIDLSINGRVWHGTSDYAILLRTYSILNVLLFIPYGFIISIFSIISNRGNKFRIFVATLFSILMSIIIEFSQLLSQRGYFELDDMMCNTLGGIIGACLYCIWIKILDLFVNKRESNC